MVIVDTDNTRFEVSIDALGKIIANNDVFVTELTENQEFITKLGDNTQFIENIINQLKGKYGNVGFNTTTNTFFYYDENYNPVTINWDSLNTKIKTFEVDEANDVLVIVDTDNTRFEVSIDALGKIIANNDVFVTELTKNEEFITKLGNNNDFQTIIKNNSAEAVLSLTDELVNNKGVKAGFTFNNGKNTDVVAFAETLTAIAKGKDGSQQIAYSFIDETGKESNTKITVTQDIIDDFELILNNQTVIDLLKQFISTASGDITVKRENGDIIISNSTEAFNLTTEIKNKETVTTIVASGQGVYEYKNEDAIKTNSEGVKINVIEDVQNNFQTIVNDNRVENILNEFINNAIVINYSYDEVIKPEKWLNTTKKVAVRMFDITLNEKTNIIEVNGDFAELVLNARLINKTTNSITEGVIRKAVANGKTQLVLGIPGALSVLHPAGNYYLILEYVKK